MPDFRDAQNPIADELLRRIDRLALYPALRDAEAWKALREELRGYLDRLARRDP